MISLALGLLAAPSALAAQKTIILSDSLAAHAERLTVAKGAQWFGQIARWRLGDYAVVSSKNGGTTTRTSGNLFTGETASASTERFSFVFANAADSATVDAARHVTVKTPWTVKLGNGWSLSSSDLAQEADNFIAIVTVNRDSTDTWALVMGYEAFLTNGARRIVLVTASSNKDVSDVRGPPALGYQFVENGQSIAALQYFGGSAARAPVAWIDRDVDARMKLILAAAMTALLQVKSL